MMNSQIRHHIPHRFSGTVRIITTCNVCDRPMFIGYKCRDCKYYCHSDCVKVAPNSCSLSDSLFEVFRQTIDNNNNRKLEIVKSLRNTASTKNSTNSIFWAVLEDEAESAAIEDESNEVRPKSLISREWNIPFNDLVLEHLLGASRFGSVYRGTWHGSVAIRLLTTSAKAKGNVRKELAEFESFRQAVSSYRKIRHDNLVLFMGASAKPPHQFAIVTALCKGLSLHKHIHVRQDRFNLNRIVSICKQICQGMGYLHSRSIVHKDLRTKNIFYENGNIIITDYCGLSALSFVATSQKGLSLPNGYLSYLAPEIIRLLRINSSCSCNDSLPYSFSSDIYAFGTVLYELLLGTWPFVGQKSEIIIWQVGRGMKQPLFNFKASREVKDLLMQCWAFSYQVRPDFSKDLPDRLNRLPKHMQRAPSHPVQLDKSISDLDLL